MLIIFVHFVLDKLVMKYIICYFVHFCWIKAKLYWKFSLLSKTTQTFIVYKNCWTQKILMTWRKCPSLLISLWKYLSIDVTEIFLSIGNWSIWFCILHCLWKCPWPLSIIWYVSMFSSICIYIYIYIYMDAYSRCIFYPLRYRYCCNNALFLFFSWTFVLFLCLDCHVCVDVIPYLCLYRAGFVFLQ